MRCKAVPAALLSVPALFLANLAFVPAGQAFTVTSQSRSVDASANVENFDTGEQDSESAAFSAPDFAPFTQGAGANASIDAGYAGASGTQSSQILPNGLLAYGTFGCSAEAWDFGAEAFSSCGSEFEVTFDIAASTPYSLSGFVSAFDSGYTSLNLSEATAGSIFSTDASGGEWPFDTAGTFAPGTYTLRISASGGAYGDFSFSDYASGDYDVALQILNATPVREGMETSSWGSVKSLYR